MLPEAAQGFGAAVEPDQDVAVPAAELADEAGLDAVSEEAAVLEAADHAGGFEPAGESGLSVQLESDQQPHPSKQGDDGSAAQVDSEGFAEPAVKAAGQPEVAVPSEAGDLVEVEPPKPSLQKQQLVALLKPEQVTLSGDWDLSKWCYWIEQAGLEPSVASLAKKGLIQGSSSGKSQITFAVASKIMVEAFGAKLKGALEESLSGIEVVFEFAPLSGPTPETEQNKRKRQVQQQAERYLREENLIEALGTQYQASLSGVTLSLS